MILTIPDIRQTAGHDCGDAAVQAVCAFLGVRPPPKMSNPVQGLSPDMVEASFRSAGLPVLSGAMGVCDLRHLTRSGRPVMCPITDVDHCGHWVIVTGVHRGYVHLHCPVDGAERMRVDVWLSRWTDRTRFGQAFDAWGIAAGNAVETCARRK